MGSGAGKSVWSSGDDCSGITRTFLGRLAWGRWSGRRSEVPVWPKVPVLMCWTVRVVVGGVVDADAGGGVGGVNDDGAAGRAAVLLPVIAV